MFWLSPVNLAGRHYDEHKIICVLEHQSGWPSAQLSFRKAFSNQTERVPLQNSLCCRHIKSFLLLFFEIFSDNMFRKLHETSQQWSRWHCIKSWYIKMRMSLVTKWTCRFESTYTWRQFFRENFNVLIPCEKFFSCNAHSFRASHSF